VRRFDQGFCPLTLPGHAAGAILRSEAPGTRSPHPELWRPSREATSGLPASGWSGDWVDGMANICESPRTHRQPEQAKGADRLEPKGARPGAGAT
jgi:hypothetical protein